MGMKLNGQEKEVDNQCDLEWVNIWCSQVDLDYGMVYLGIYEVTYLPGIQWFK